MTGDRTVTVAGRWYRVFWGETGNRKPVLRYSRFYGHRLWAVRLWSLAGSTWRIVGFQMRKAEQ